MRILFTGPDGAPFIGKELESISIARASLEDLAALQRGTKLTMQEIMTRLQRAEEGVSPGSADETDDEVEDPYNDLADSSKSADEMFNMQVGVFLALRTAGYRIHWRVARDMRFGDFDVIVDDEPEDTETESDEESVADPQVAQTDSPRDAVDAAQQIPMDASLVSPQ